MHKLRWIVAIASLGVIVMPAITMSEDLVVPAPIPAQPPQPPEDSGASSAWNAKVAPAKSHEGIDLNERQLELVEQVSEYFRKLDTLKGRFVQTAADNKRMRGKFYVKRPGRFRFDYARPSRQIVISDGRYLAIQDLDLNNEDRVALNQTPFRLVLRSDVNLVRDARIIEVQESEDMIMVGIEDKDPNAPGQIRLLFTTKPHLELKEWITKDAQGLDTRVEVSDLVTSVELHRDLFRIRPLGKPFGTP
ncbi:MAG: outer membrane lipoprotein carrier protein LolA [Hyphomicrobium sp.]